MEKIYTRYLRGIKCSYKFLTLRECFELEKGDMFFVNSENDREKIYQITELTENGFEGIEKPVGPLMNYIINGSLDFDNPYIVDFRKEYMIESTNYTSICKIIKTKKESIDMEKYMEIYSMVDLCYPTKESIVEDIVTVEIDGRKKEYFIMNNRYYTPTGDFYIRPEGLLGGCRQEIVENIVHLLYLKQYHEGDISGIANTNKLNKIRGSLKIIDKYCDKTHTVTI